MIEEAFNCSSAWKANRWLYLEYIEEVEDIQCIVELGVDSGFSLFCFAQNHPGALVVGVDDFSCDPKDVAKKHLQKYLHLFPNVRFFESEIGAMRKTWADPEVYCDIDILHIDANHSYDLVKRDFELWIDAVRPGGVVLFHDIMSFPEDVGSFFNGLEGKKKRIDVGPGLGFYFKPDDEAVAE